MNQIKNFDYILEIAKEHDVVLSLTNSMMINAITDFTDRFQVQKLIILGKLLVRILKIWLKAFIMVKKA